MCTYLPERRGGAYTGDAVREWLCGLLLLQLTFADSIRNLLVRRGGGGGGGGPGMCVLDVTRYLLPSAPFTLQEASQWKQQLQASWQASKQQCVVQQAGLGSWRHPFTYLRLPVSRNPR